MRYHVYIIAVSADDATEIRGWLDGHCELTDDQEEASAWSVADACRYLTEVVEHNEDDWEIEFAGLVGEGMDPPLPIN